MRGCGRLDDEDKDEAEDEAEKAEEKARTMTSNLE